MEQVREEIEALKREKDAVILAHYYVEGAVKDVADYVGDSYYLAKLATELPQKTIVLCGVTFMGESVKLLNPEKTVLMPDMTAGCPMAEMYDLAKIAELRQEFPDLAVVCYVNSTLELKGHADVCVTSANAVKVVKALPNQNIFFVPDGNLGAYVKAQVPEKNILLHDGFCYVHSGIQAEAVRQAKLAHPEAEVLAHPECREEILALADYIGSTSGILQRASASPAREFIILTEMGIAYDLNKNEPNKTFRFPGNRTCDSMKKVTLDKVLQVLKSGNNAMAVDGALSDQAAQTLNQMLLLAR